MRSSIEKVERHVKNAEIPSVESLKPKPRRVGRPKPKGNPTAVSLEIKDKRRHAILALLKQGLNSRQIADRLGVGIMVVAGYEAAYGTHIHASAARQTGPKATDWEGAQRKAAKVGKWAVTMAKVRIRQALARHRWQLVTFLGPRGAEAAGIVDLLAVRKDFSDPPPGLRRGDKLQMLLIQVKGGSARDPTPSDIARLRGVARLHGAQTILLSNWKKGAAARFSRLQADPAAAPPGCWIPVEDIDAVFR
jgi:hypothetical protein